MVQKLCLSLVVLLAACANEVMTTRPPDLDAGGNAGAGSAGTAGVGGSTITAGSSSSSAGSASASGGSAAGGSGAEPGAGTAGSGGTLEGGTGGNAGTAGSVASAGTAGSAGNAGSGGGAPVVEQISMGKASTTDSEEAAKGNTVDMGNDGQDDTRWCANDSALGHWWAVDLGQSYTLTQIQVLWEKAVAYQYLIEVSDDGSSWSSLADRTDSTSTSQLQAVPIADEAARHVRITVTGLPEGSWASFFEFRVYGY